MNPSTCNLNDYIQSFIQMDGLAFVISNYIDLREQYYIWKQT